MQTYCCPLLFGPANCEKVISNVFVYVCVHACLHPHVHYFVDIDKKSWAYESLCNDIYIDFKMPLTALLFCDETDMH